MNKIARVFSAKAIGRLAAMVAMACAVLIPAGAMAADWNIDQLMQLLAGAKPERARFVEKKYLSMLDRPVESSGELRYTAPDRLEKRTLKPKAESMVVEGNTLTIERGKQQHVIQMQEYPELAAFIDSIRGTLAGNRSALERTFKLKLEGSKERWKLQLTPADASIGRNVHMIRIEGVQDDVRSIEIIQTDGDRSQMTIERIATR
jgi:outer membrane lipoprotein-sorting protein